MSIEKKIELVQKKVIVEEKIASLFKQKSEIEKELDKEALTDVDSVIEQAHEFLKENQ